MKKSIMEVIAPAGDGHHEREEEDDADKEGPADRDALVQIIERT